MSLEEIIQGCRKKDAQCQRALVMNYSAMLLTVSKLYMPSDADAEDIMQDAFIKIFDKFKQYDEHKGSLASWMRTVVINTALKRLKKPFLKHEIHLEILPEVTVLPEIYDKLNAEEIMELIAELPDGYRHVFNLYAVEGYSHKEIGALLGIKSATSRSNYTRAKSLLKKKLNHHKMVEKWAKTG